MRLSLIGPGNIEYHYNELLGINKGNFGSEIDGIADSLVESGVEIALLPDKGVSFELAKLYKKKGGKRVIGVVPESDNEIGIKHLESFIKEGVHDEIINSGDWYKHDMTKALFGNAVLYLGRSPGVDIEKNAAEYLYKFLERVKIHDDIKAGKGYTIIVYSPFLKGGRLTFEEEGYLKKDGIGLVYVRNGVELKGELERLKDVVGK